MSRITSSCLALALLASVTPASAEAPAAVGVPLRFSPLGGTPLTGTYSLSVSFHTASTSGSLIASEVEDVFPEDDGVAVTTMGDTSVLDPADYLDPVWAAFRLDGGPELSPRVEVLPAPFALRAIQTVSTATRVVTVDPSGSDAENGTALLAAAAGITDSSASKPYVLQLGPGTYDLGSSGLTVPGHVRLVGAGRDATTVRASGFFPTLTLSEGGGLSDLRILARPSISTGVAVELEGTSMVRIERAHLLVEGQGASLLQALQTQNAPFVVRDSLLECEDFDVDNSIQVVNAFAGSGNDVRRFEGTRIVARGDKANNAQITGISFFCNVGSGLVVQGGEISLSNQDVGLMYGVEQIGPEPVVLRHTRIHAEAGNLAIRTSQGPIYASASQLSGTIDAAGGEICGAGNFDEDLAPLSIPCAAPPPDNASILFTVTTSGVGQGLSFQYPRPSTTGRYVVWSTFSDTDLVPGDNDGHWDCFLRDTVNETTEIVSLADDESNPDADSTRPDVSGDGRYVVFASKATNIVGAATTTDRQHIYVRDRTLGTTTILTRPGGVEADGNSQDPRISQDGAYVVFSSSATNLVTGDTNDWKDAFRVEVANPDNIVRVSVTDAEMQANFPDESFGIGEVTVSGDGSRVVFAAFSTDLVPGASGYNIFLRDLTAGTTTLVSTDLGGSPIPDATNARPRISADGSFVCYTSNDDVFPDDSDGSSDILRAQVGATNIEQASVADGAAGGNVGSFAVDCSISGDGRYVTFTGFAAGYDPAIVSSGNQVYVRDFTADTTRVVSSANGETGGDSSTISHDGTQVAYGTSANLVPEDGGSGSHPDGYLTVRP